MDLQDVKNKIAEKYECLGWDMLLLNLTLSGDFRRDYKITETMVWNELAETYASLQCAEMKKENERLRQIIKEASIITGDDAEHKDETQEELWRKVLPRLDPIIEAAVIEQLLSEYTIIRKNK